MLTTSSASTSAGEEFAGTGPADEAFPRWAPVGMCVGPWRIVRGLGQGGYGVVYLAEDTRPVSAGGVAGPVALKLAAGRTKEEDPQAARRLLREGDILRRVVHPQVVRLLGQGEHRGVPYLVLEYVAGPDFYGWSSLRNRTARELVERVATLALTLHAAHEAGVFHRDLKGTNVLMREPDGQPVLLDFGVGDYDGASTLTATVLPPGTAHYRSTEAVRFLWEKETQPGARYAFTLADELYALGVVLYRLLTDEYPFPPGIPLPLLYERILETEPPAPVALNPRVPRSVSGLTMRLLSKTPAERGASAKAVSEALRAAMADGDAWWDGFLFEWDDGPSTHSRSTEEAELVGPIAPGHEVGLMHAAAQQQTRRVEQRQKRALRKRPRLPEPAPVPVPVPAVPDRRVPGRRLGSRAAWGLLVVVGLLGLVWTAREMAQSRVASLVSPTKEGQPVNMQKARSAHSQEQEAGGSNVSEGARLVERCAAAAAAGLVLSACAGVPARPPERDCSEEAYAAMRKLRVTEGEEFQLVVDVNRPGEPHEVATFRDGPIVSVLPEDLRLMPAGTLVYGYLWVSGERIIGHYDRAKLPGGEIIPVCIAIGGSSERKPGLPKLWGSKAPGTVEMAKTIGVTVVYRFEYE